MLRREEHRRAADGVEGQTGDNGAALAEKPRGDIETRRVCQAAPEEGAVDTTAPFDEQVHDPQTAQVRHHGRRRLIAVAWILAQHALDDFIQHARHRQAEAP